MARSDQPTAPQLAYLYKLAGSRVAERYGSCGEERIEAVGAIVEDRRPNRGDVSDWIDWFTRQPIDATEQRPARRREEPKDKFDVQTLDIGVYERPDGEVYLVKWNRPKTRKYAEHAVPSTPRATESGATAHIEFVYEKGSIFTLRPEMRMSAERAWDLSIKYGRCICCGHGLKVEDSVLRGIGPVCLKKYFSEDEQQRIKTMVRELKARAKAEVPVPA